MLLDWLRPDWLGHMRFRYRRFQVLDPMFRTESRITVGLAPPDWLGFPGFETSLALVVQSRRWSLCNNFAIQSRRY
jgi:hypothetical protein